MRCWYWQCLTIELSRAAGVGLNDVLCVTLEKNMDLSEKNWDEAICIKGSDDVQLDAAKGTAAIAWGWLWHVITADDRVKTARHLLGQMLDKDLKRYGIQTAKAEGAQVNMQEIEAAMLRGEFGDA